MPRWYYNIPTPKVFDGANQATTPVYLNYGQSINEQGAASDMHYAFDDVPYEQSSNPTSLAKDNYSVMGPGISGSIEPYRLDIGSLSMPRQMTVDHVRIAMMPFQRKSLAKFL